MATPASEAEAGRGPSYPAIPRETWWRLRKQFKSKGAPKPWNEEYLVNIGVRTSLPSARNVVRPFKRMRFFTDDGKATDRYWDWLDDAKYHEVCQQILQESYPSSVVNTFASTDDDERKRLEGWFQRNQEVKPSVASQYAGFYMLLLKGDVSEQDEVPSQKPAAAPIANGGSKRNSRPRTRESEVRSSASNSNEVHASGALDTSDRHEEDHYHSTPRRETRHIEPSLNINIQIHIPAEASSQQIDQIFESMGKHLYRRQGEIGE
jgi:hypothetical protein